MNTLKGARVPIARKGNNFVVEIMVRSTEERKEDEYIIPKQKKVATKKWSTARNMDVDEGRVHTKNKFGALSVTDEEEYEAASVFAGRGRGI